MESATDFEKTFLLYIIETCQPYNLLQKKKLI